MSEAQYPATTLIGFVVVIIAILAITLILLNYMRYEREAYFNEKGTISAKIGHEPTTRGTVVGPSAPTSE